MPISIGGDANVHRWRCLCTAHELNSMVIPAIKAKIGDTIFMRKFNGSAIPIWMTNCFPYGRMPCTRQFLIGNFCHINRGISCQKNTIIQYRQSMVQTDSRRSMARTIRFATFSVRINNGYFLPSPSKSVFTKPGRMSVNHIFNPCICANCSSASM